MKDIFESVYFEKALDPQDNTGNGAATIPSTYIDVSDFDYFAFLVSVGTHDGTLDAQVVQATASDGSDSKNVANAAITQLVDANDNEQAGIVVETRQLDINNDFRYVALTLTEAATTGQLADVWFMAWNAGEEPVTQHSDFSEQVFVGG